MDSPTSATQLLRCICDITEWMSSNRLKLNADKTQFIWLGSPQLLASVRMEELSIGGAAVAPVDTARDLGVTLCDVYVGGKVRVLEFMIFLTLQHNGSK